jgi:hypothetical protein
LRLDAIDTRLAEVLGGQPNRGGKVRNSVNELKHDVDAHLSGQNPVLFDDAVVAGRRLIAQLQRIMS